jgi:tetratricopeptide (TPR) repeat protein
MPENDDETRALELAQKGIEQGAAGNFEEAARAWQAASDFADEHLEGADIYYWIKSGLGAALFDVGRYEESITVSGLALDWCRRLGQPLPALTMAKAYFKLDDRSAALSHIDIAHGLVGDAILDQLDTGDRQAAESHLRAR